MDKDILNHMEEEYGVLESESNASMIKSLEKKKKIYLATKSVGIFSLFSRLNVDLMKEKILASRLDSSHQTQS